MSGDLRPQIYGSTNYHCEIGQCTRYWRSGMEREFLKYRKASNHIPASYLPATLVRLLGDELPEDPGKAALAQSLCGAKAITRSGLPEPPLIFRGVATMTDPKTGS